MSRRRSRGERGFTLVEVAFTIGTLSIAALLLTMSLTSSQRMSAMAREKAIASSAIRSYIERMRQKYPVSGSTDMGYYLGDSDTPLVDLTSMTANSLEGSAMRDVQAVVLKGTDETGTNWGPVALGGGIANPGSAMSTADRSALGCPRDLDCDGDETDTSIPTSSQYLVPVKIQLSWRTNSGGKTTSGGTVGRTTVTVYAAFTIQH